MQTNDPIAFSTLKRAFYFSAGLFCLFSCFAALGANEISRTYDYKGFDTNGNLLVQGTITLNVDETNNVKGDWQLKILDKNLSKRLGPQDGSGKVTGQLKGDAILLNLNPAEFGDNILLDGKVTKADIFKINGKWGHYGFYAGKISDGVFEMVRTKDPPK